MCVCDTYFGCLRSVASSRIQFNFIAILYFVYFFIHYFLTLLFRTSNSFSFPFAQSMVRSVAHNERVQTRCDSVCLNDIEIDSDGRFFSSSSLVLLRWYCCIHRISHQILCEMTDWQCPPTSHSPTILSERFQRIFTSSGVFVDIFHLFVAGYTTYSCRMGISYLQIFMYRESTSRRLLKVNELYNDGDDSRWIVIIIEWYLTQKWIWWYHMVVCTVLSWIFTMARRDTSTRTNMNLVHKCAIKLRY